MSGMNSETTMKATAPPGKQMSKESLSYIRPSVTGATDAARFLIQYFQ